MKNFFYSLSVAFLIFFVIDFIFGNKILKVLYDKEIILSEEKKINEIKRKRIEKKKL